VARSKKSSSSGGARPRKPVRGHTSIASAPRVSPGAGGQRRPEPDRASPSRPGRASTPKRGRVASASRNERTGRAERKLELEPGPGAQVPAVAAAATPEDADRARPCDAAVPPSSKGPEADAAEQIWEADSAAEIGATADVPPGVAGPGGDAHEQGARQEPPKPAGGDEQTQGEGAQGEGAQGEGAERAQAAVSEKMRRIAEQIRELEGQLGKMMDESAGAAGPGQQSGAAVPSRREHPRRPTRAAQLERPGGAEGGMFDAARELLSSDYYLRQWGRLGMRNRSEVVDDFGHDPTYDGRVQPLLDFLFARYFRVQTDGVENVPAQGRALVVVNHSGTLPLDGLMLKTAIRREHPQRRELRWLTEDFFFYLPFVGSFMNRLGAVRACQENAERLLDQERLVGVFPEGVKGTGRLFRDRYKLQRFGRGGFIRLCLRTRTPLVPCAIVGAEESVPLLHRIEYLAQQFGLPYLPVTPAFPLLGPLGLLPAPTKWHIVVGAPITFEGYGPEAASDHVLVGRLAERVRATIQSMIDRALAARRSVWFG
jgi:1-acyl-sn-glycerol-3-phosphate acyltransferase